jgi:hypothetical protein
MENVPILRPTTLDEAIQNRVYFIRQWDKPGISVPLKRTLDARIKIYETAPRDENKLRMMLMAKLREIRICHSPGQYDIPRAEEDALRDLLYLVSKYSTKPEP